MATKQEIKDYYKELKNAIRHIQNSALLNDREKEELTDALLERIKIVYKWFVDEFDEDDLKDLDNN